MRRLSAVGICALAALTAGSLNAQDSVSIQGGCPGAPAGGGPGDAVSPWDLSEQSNRYVVDLSPFMTRGWRDVFGIAPIIKASKTEDMFPNGFIGSQAISRTQLQNVPVGGGYGWWPLPGFGVNGNLAVNMPPPTALGNITNANQFTVAFQESGSTILMNSDHDGIIAGVIGFDPSDPGRLYVDRVVAATAGCDGDSEWATFGMGAVDAAGNVIFRADSFGVTAGASTCGGLTNLDNNNIFVVNASARNTGALNVISNEYPAGMFDTPATTWIVQQSSNVHNVPNIADINGPFYIGSAFNTEYVRGASAGSVVSGSSHLVAGANDHRGNVSYLTQNHPTLRSTHGIAGLLAWDGNDESTILNIWGLDSSGNVTATLGLTPPAVLTNPFTGATNRPGGLTGPNEFDYYHSQVAFQGGNGQVSMNMDADGTLIVAAVMDHPNDSGPNHNEHFIPVARVDSAGVVSWSMAAYNTSDAGGSAGPGQPILDGPGGNVIGQLTTLDKVTGGIPAMNPNGPSFSPPMVDSAGNIWFLSAIELFQPQDFTTGLIRAVFDPVMDAYELDLVFRNGFVTRGQNSQTEYQIQFMPIADGNSVSSSTAWSHNISEQGHGGQRHVGSPYRDPLHMGGMVIHVSITYDVDGDSDFDPCTTDPTSRDERYAALMYVGAMTDAQVSLGGQGPGNAQLTLTGQGLNAGERSTLRMTGAPSSTLGALFISQPNMPDLPVAGGTLVSGAGFLATIPILTSPTGEVRAPIRGVGTAADLVIQMVAVDPTLPQQVAFTNALLAKFGR